MPNSWRPRTGETPRCPHCHRNASFLATWSYRGAWGYAEVRTYECPEHGPMFVSEPATGVTPLPAAIWNGISSQGDWDAPILAPRKPAPTLNAGAVAVTEPESP